MRVTFVADVSQVDGPVEGLQGLLEEALVGEVVIVARADQLLDDLPDSAVEVVCNEGDSPARRAALGLQQASNPWVIYSAGPLPTAVTQRLNTVDITDIAIARVERRARVGTLTLSDGGSEADSFFINLHRYCTLRGFSTAATMSESIANFILRCEFMGWKVSLDRPAFELSGLAPMREINDVINLAEYSPPQKVPLIANLPAWRERPHWAGPLVTVAIATYNRADYLKDAIETVLAQSFQDFEIVIVDDGSDDHTSDIVSGFLDERIVYKRIENSGIAAARNVATDMSKGYFTAVHDSDDLMLPDRLEKGLRALHNDAKASYGAWVNFDDTNGQMVMHVTKPDFDLSIISNNGQTPGHPTWLVPTDLLRTLRYDERLSSAVDHNVAIRSALLDVKWVHVGEAVMLRRIHDGQISETDSKRQKIGAMLSRQLAVSGVSLSEESKLADAAQARRWPSIAEKSNLSHFFDRYLPDRLTRRIVEVTGPIASKVGILTSFQSGIAIGAQLDAEGNARGGESLGLQPSMV